MKIMKIEQRKTADLIPYARNAKKHDDNQIAQIAASIKEFGFNDPVEITVDNVIIAGHGRVLAAQKLGLTEVPVVIHSHLNDNQRKAYTLLNNRLAETGGGWDTEMLKLELDELPEFDLSCFGEVLEGLLEQDISLNGLTDDDEVPEPPKKARTELGRIYQLGKHRLMCGDSTSKEEVKRLMGNDICDLCFTSPPYNAGSLNIKGKEFTKEKYNSFNDNQSEDDYFDFLTSSIDCAMEYCEEVFYNIGLVENNKRVIIQVINKYIDKFKDIIYWKKNTVAPHIQNGVINNLVEFIICFGDGKRKFKNAQFHQGSYWNVIEGKNASGNEYAKIHKATFPVYLPAEILNNFSNKNSIIYEPFGGSGTTLIACEQTNRQCRMMELDPIYCDVIVERYCKLKGIDSDKVFETGIAE